mmetsp:Transcript_10409/g.15586  ORF Transcript_10409/g.15586 Transcript_10409/m.15586 type:complete len:519 (+) Transcript_10409:121-1677(+)
MAFQIRSRSSRRPYVKTKLIVQALLFCCLVSAGIVTVRRNSNLCSYLLLSQQIHTEEFEQATSTQQNRDYNNNAGNKVVVSINRESANSTTAGVDEGEGNYEDRHNNANDTNTNDVTSSNDKYKGSEGKEENKQHHSNESSIHDYTNINNNTINNDVNNSTTTDDSSSNDGNAKDDIKVAIGDENRSSSITTSSATTTTAEDDDNIKVPSVILVGTQKGGTEALQEYLKLHPNMTASIKYEPHFFNTVRSPHEYLNGTIPAQDIPSYIRKYKKHAFNMKYLKSHPNQTTFEKTPRYMFDRKAPYRIKSVAPDAKIIMLLRDPVERAYSHFKMKSSKGYYYYTGRSFEDCIALDMKMLKRAGVIAATSNGIVSKNTGEGDDEQDEDGERPLDIAWMEYMRIPMQKKCDAMIGRGIYALQLRIWWKVYAAEDERRDQILVYKSEDLLPDKNNHVDLQTIYNFIGVPDMNLKGEQKKIHVALNHTPMRSKSESMLRDFYRPFNEELFKLIGDNWFSPWGGY